jgi:uncharacterized protein
MNEKILEATIAYVKNELKGAEAGHDWFHIYRVWNNAKKISEKEEVNVLIVELGALLHDIADSKFHAGNEKIGPEKARTFLESLFIDKAIISHVVQIIENISFKGGNFNQSFFSPELAVVQDADRLDAIGAIGTARAFHYGGFKNRVIYDPTIPPNLLMDKEQYKNSDAPTINHFYEKLLLLKDKMNTNTGRILAESRHTFMQNFLDQFYQEWNAD